MSVDAWGIFLLEAFNVAHNVHPFADLSLMRLQCTEEKINIDESFVCVAGWMFVLESQQCFFLGVICDTFRLSIP